MEKAVKPAYFVLDTVKADILFRNMKKEHHTLAVVLDEYGGMSGIITINDLVEQLVGDLGDETVGTEAAPIEKVGENSWKIQGTASLEDISEELGISLSCEEYDTFSGFVLHEFGSIPEEGAVIETEISDLHISAAGIKNHQVEKAIVSIKTLQSEL